MSKEENKLIVFYDEVGRKNIYKLNGVDVSDAIENLLEKHEKEIVDTKCKLFQLDMSIQMELQKHIADLEAKLAESEKQVTDLEDYYSGYTEALIPEVQELKQQLAEKDKEIDERMKSFEKRCQEYYKSNEYKIDYAVLQLERARKRIDNLGYNETKCLNKADCIEDCMDVINQLITEIKEWK